MSDDLTRRGFMGLLGGIAAAGTTAINFDLEPANSKEVELDGEAVPEVQQSKPPTGPTLWLRHLGKWGKWVPLAVIAELDGPVYDKAMFMEEDEPLGGTWQRFKGMALGGGQVRLTLYPDRLSADEFLKQLEGGNPSDWRVVMPSSYGEVSTWEFSSYLTNIEYDHSADALDTMVVDMQLLGLPNYTMEEA